jgi:hypothetical protein
MAPVFSSNVAPHLLHVLAAPLPGRPAALLAGHFNAHTLFLLELSDDPLSDVLCELS